MSYENLLHTYITYNHNFRYSKVSVLLYQEHVQVKTMSFILLTANFLARFLDDTILINQQVRSHKLSQNHSYTVTVQVIMCLSLVSILLLMFAPAVVVLTFSISKDCFSSFSSFCLSLILCCTSLCFSAIQSLGGEM